MSMPEYPLRTSFNEAAIPRRPHLETGSATRFGIVASLAFLVLFILWAEMTQISGAVISSGQAVVPGKPRQVQSLEGGSVARIFVANGDRVKAGAVLLELDPTLIKAKLDMGRARLAALLARQSRLGAEQAGFSAPLYKYRALPFATPDTQDVEVGETKIFIARSALRQGRRDQLAERLAQLDNQTAGLLAQMKAREEQLVLLERDLSNVKKLYANGMAHESQMLDLQSSQAGMLGDLAGNRTELARFENAGRDASIEASQAENSFLEQVATDLRSTSDEIEERILEIITLSNQLERVKIRAPSDGIVHEMQVTTIGGVVPPGAIIMQIVPQNGPVEFEVRLPAKELERVHVGQGAELMFSGLDHRTTPRIEARVASISPAAINDPQTGQSFYRLTVTVTPTELARLGDVELLPGMPVEAFLHTADRSVMSYLVAPMQHQLMLAFRER